MRVCEWVCGWAARWRCHRWAWSPSVGWDVMVDLRRTQKSKSLLVFPLFSHLRKEKKNIEQSCMCAVISEWARLEKHNYVFYRYTPKEGHLCASLRAGKWRWNQVFLNNIKQAFACYPGGANEAQAWISHCKGHWSHKLSMLVEPIQV